MPNTWTTKWGETLRIVDMGDEHLFNAIKCTERWAKREAFRTGQTTSHVLGGHRLYHALVEENLRRNPVTPAEKITVAALIAVASALAYRLMVPQ